MKLPPRPQAQKLSDAKRAQIQQTADNLHVPLYVTVDGSIKHLRPGDSPPDGAEVFKPQKEWADAPHGSDPQYEPGPEVRPGPAP